MDLAPALLLAWLALEAVFFAYQTWRYQQANQVDTDWPKDSVRRRVQQFTSLAGVINIQEFFSGWFMHAPFESIRRENALDLVAYGFWYRDRSSMSKRERKEVAGVLREMEATFGLCFPPGHDPDLRFMDHLLRPLRVCHKPMLVHLLSEATVLACHVCLHLRGFRAFSCEGVTYWAKGLPPPRAQEARTGSFYSGLLSRVTPPRPNPDPVCADVERHVAATCAHSIAPFPDAQACYGPTAYNHRMHRAIREAAAAVQHGVHAVDRGAELTAPSAAQRGPVRPGAAGGGPAGGLRRSASGGALWASSGASPFLMSSVAWVARWLGVTVPMQWELEDVGPAQSQSLAPGASMRRSQAGQQSHNETEPIFLPLGSGSGGNTKACTPARPPPGCHAAESRAADASNGDTTDSGPSLRSASTRASSSSRLAAHSADDESTPRFLCSEAGGLDDGCAADGQPAWALPKAAAAAWSLKREPLVFLHGVGFGLLPYLGLVWKLCNMLPGQPVVLPEVRHVSLRLCLQAREVADIGRAVLAILERHGMTRAHFAAHSYGTFVVAHLRHLFPEAVLSMLLFDPVCMLTCCPHLLSNFIYKKVTLWTILKNPLDLLTFLVARDLIVARTFSRRFFWHTLMLWPEELTDVTVISLSNNDALVPCALVQQQVDLAMRRCSGKDVMYSKDINVIVNPGEHGQLLMKPAVQDSVIAVYKSALLRSCSARQCNGFG